MSRRDAALALAAHGIKVHPVSPETKAPLTKHGHLDGTTSPAAINAWWGMWPDAWPGMNLAASGLVVVAPDSPQHLADFERRGVDTPARWNSPGGAGHIHHAFRRPAGCPTTRICRSGEYDIMSDGYSIAYLDDAASVPNMNGALPDAPEWVVDWLKEAAAKKARPTKSTVEDAAEGPPVELSDHDLATWQGKHAKIATKGKRAGQVNRSSSLMAIGRVLYDAGMTRRGVVAELAARDHDLDWHKFCCNRTDGGAQYNAIMDELERNGRSPRVNIGRDASIKGDASEPPTDASPCQDQLAKVQAENSHLKRTLGAIMAVVRNEGLTPAERIAGVVTTFHVVEGRQARKADDEGAVVTFVPKVAERAGLPERTYSRTLKNLEAFGWAERRHATVRAFDHATKQYTKTSVTQLRVILPGETIAEALAPLAQIKPARTRAGGARPRQCPKHPEADVYSRTTWHCAVCHERITDELSVDTETGEIFGDIRPEGGQNGGPSDDDPDLFDWADAPGNEQPPLEGLAATDGQNGGLNHSGLDRQNGGPVEADTGGQNGRPSPRSQPAPDLCTDCGKRPPVAYRTRCQPCILVGLPQKRRAAS